MRAIRLREFTRSEWWFLVVLVCLQALNVALTRIVSARVAFVAMYDTYEPNPLSRWLMNHEILIVVKLMIPFALAVAIALRPAEKVPKFFWGVVVIYFLVVVSNISQLSQFVLSM